MKRPVLIGLAVIIILFIGSAFPFAIFQPIKVLPRIRLSPGFAMLDQNAQQVTNESLRGSIVVFSYTYSRCPESCRPTLQTLNSLQTAIASLDTGGFPVKLVTISLDSQHDPPQTSLSLAQANQTHP